MKAYAVCTEGRSEKDMEIFVDTESDSRLPSSYKEEISEAVVRIDAVHFIYISGTGIYLAVKRYGFSLAVIPSIDKSRPV